MSRIEDTECRFEGANVTLFLVLGAMSFCERLAPALLPRGDDRNAEPAREVDVEHPAHLVALGLESFGRTVRTLCDAPARDAEPDRSPRAPAASPPFRRLLR